MMAANKSAKVIGLWLDGTSGCGDPQWIVSRDEMNANGEAETTRTVETFEADAYDAAREKAIELGRKDGLCVIETESDQSQTCIYSPRN